MESQIYLDDLIKEAGRYIHKTNEFREKFPEFFNNYTGESILSMSDDKMSEFFKTSQIINDTQTLFNKISSFLYFCKKVNIDLNIEKLTDVKGLSEFISSYTPFQTDYLITESGEMNIVNKKENSLKLEEFKKSIKNLIKNNILNENGE